MSWIQNLSDTYDQCQSMVGKNDGGKNNAILMPLFHLQLNAQIEIYINEKGCFIRAEEVPEDEQATICPVSEDSASRSSGITPMPLFDKLSYLAGDYDCYSQDKKSKRSHFDAYINQLQKWVNSEFSCKPIQAIYVYLKKEHVMQDLMRTMKLDSKNQDSFVRFIVESSDSMDEKVWENNDVQNSFIQYTLSNMQNSGLCYATGKQVPLTHKLPAKIRNSSDKAKIISSNDNSGYTFRGRFNDANEAVGIGYVTSQKAHNALRWLISRQGYVNESERIVCWSTKEIKTIEPYDSFWKLFPEEEKQVNTHEDYAYKLNNLLAGYRTELKGEKVSIISVDTADGSNQGRLSITYYNELMSEDYISRLNKWYIECSWKLHRKIENDYFIGTPTPLDIARAAYGVDQETKLIISNKKLKKKCIDRILSCILENRKLPSDILQSAVNNASNPQKYTKKNWEFLLEVTCALIRKHNIDCGKGEYSAMLEEDKYKKDRDYLFGMLLAVFDDIENTYYYKTNSGQRETNASKLWNVYSRYPARTATEIRNKLQPYLSRMDRPIKENQSKRIEQILVLLKDIDGFTNKSLNENYLLGYYCEKAEIRKLRIESKQ